VNQSPRGDERPALPRREAKYPMHRGSAAMARLAYSGCHSGNEYTTPEAMAFSLPTSMFHVKLGDPAE
jgi:hypothetical protein